MHIMDLVFKINSSVEELDFATARFYMEENIEILNDNKNYLKSNARELLEFLMNRQEAGQESLTRREMSVIQATNGYAAKFDVRGLKLVIKEHSLLFLRDDIEAYLNADARIILEGMGAIRKAG
jgi:hypothetical protein